MWVYRPARMLGCELPAGAGCHSDHDRDTDLSAGHMSQGCGVIDDLIERQQTDVDGHDFDDRSHAIHGRANASAHEG